MNSLLHWFRGNVATSEKEKVLNGIRVVGVTASQGAAQLYYRNQGESTLFSAESRDGLTFEEPEKVTFLPSEHEALLENIRFYSHEHYTHAQYKLPSQTPWHPSVTKDMLEFHPTVDNSAIEPLVELYDPERDERIRYSGGHNIFAYAVSKDGKLWKEEKLVLTSRRGFFDDGSLIPELCFNVEEGIMLLYTSRKKHQGIDSFSVGAALFDSADPGTLLWRSEKPLWEQSGQWKNKHAVPVGVILFNQHIYMYVQIEDQGVHVVLLPSAALLNHVRYHAVSPKLDRHHKNPLIAPTQHNAWEAFTTFNAAALYTDEKFHIVYRAQGYDYISVLGYASSKDGVTIDEKLDAPIYHPREHFEFVGEDVAADPSKIAQKFMSGGGYGGCEDPRLTLIDGKVYMTYVAFDGVNPPRVALTSIDLENFLTKNWQWERPVLISPPDVVDKNAVIFPEKVQGKYVIMHRIFPDILIDFVDSLEFDGKSWLEGRHKIMPRPDKWDSRKIGAGPPPIKTSEGWLLIYQSVGNQDPGKYKIGAMLLDLNDPTKVLYRSNSPILEPEEWYENEGFKAGVVYPCGAVVKDNILFVYYGGADSHVCVATAYLDNFLEHLMRQEEISLNPAILPVSV